MATEQISRIEGIQLLRTLIHDLSLTAIVQNSKAIFWLWRLMPIEMIVSRYLFQQKATSLIDYLGPSLKVMHDLHDTLPR